MFEQSLSLIEFTRYLSFDQRKYFIYQLIVVFTLGIAYLFFQWFESLHLYYYDEVFELKYSTHVKLEFANQKFKIVQLNHKNIKVYPHEEEITCFYFYLEKCLFIYQEDQNQFVSIGNLFFQKIKNNSEYFIKLKEYLSEQQVQQLTPLHDKNKIDLQLKSIWELILDQIVSYFFAFIVLEFFVEIFGDLYTFAVYQFVRNLLICIFYVIENYSNQNQIKKKFKENKDIKVIRIENDIKITKIINFENLMIGDIVQIEEGEINLDLIMISGECLMDESNLTGEQVLVTKQEIYMNEEFQIEQNSNMIVSGSKCEISKNAQGLVIAIGKNTIKGKTLLEQKYKKTTNIDFKTEIMKVYQVMLILGCFQSLFYIKKLFYEDNLDFYMLIIHIIYLIIFYIDSNLFFGISILYYVTQIKMEKNEIYCQEIDKINEGARIMHMGFDKTGTLTKDEIFYQGFIDKNNYQKHKILKNIQNIENQEEQLVFELFIGCCNSILIDNGIIKGFPLDKILYEQSNFKLENSNPNDRYFSANKEFLEKNNLPQDIKFEVVKIYTFNNVKKRMSIVLKYNDKYILLVKGSTQTVSNLIDNLPENYSENLKKLTIQGYRILCLGYKYLNEDEIELPQHELEEKLQFLSLLLFENQVKEDTPQAIKEIQNSGINTFIITGDVIYTTINIGYQSNFIQKKQDICIVKQYEQKLQFEIINHNLINEFFNQNSQIQTPELQQSYVDNTIDNYDQILDRCKMGNMVIGILGKDLDFIFEYFNKEQLFEFLDYCKIFSQTNQYHKAKIMKYYKQKARLISDREFVGFVGDGLNDGLALKTSDLGISIIASKQNIQGHFQTSNPSLKQVCLLLRQSKATLHSFYRIVILLITMNLSIGITIYFYFKNNINILQIDIIYFDLYLTLFIVLYTLTPTLDKLNRFKPDSQIITFSFYIFNILSYIFILTFESFEHYFLQNEIIMKDTHQIITIDNEEQMIPPEQHYFPIVNYLKTIKYILLYLALPLHMSYVYRKSIFNNIFLIIFLFLNGFIIYGSLFDNESLNFLDNFFHYLMRKPYYNETKIGMKFLLFELITLFFVSMAFLIYQNIQIGNQLVMKKKQLMKIKTNQNYNFIYKKIFYQN